MEENAEAKRALAEASVAEAEVEDGDAVMLDNGTTTVYVARALLARRNLFVITNGTDIARTLARGEGNRVHMPGGEMKTDNCSILGEASVRAMSVPSSRSCRWGRSITRAATWTTISKKSNWRAR
ncbi:DeoR C terminal sensor domain-containing protein [Roseivivax sediminis]|uniref:DeoR C terminal sensor domain-containing protein n=1 Tax=Roseivivax sediminis TaxID=936889 RepID=A0A1I2E856_9RHOB|nr:hypothetical protein [Roseivivax sediminis]SFE89015.1 DeoR C terminal sensor domain-containing protein [Roseivivax sediminis]